MSEEPLQAWKTERIVEYAKLEEDVVSLQHEVTMDIGLNKLIQKRSELDAVIIVAKEPYRKNIEAAQQQQAGIKSELEKGWGVFADKTFECAAGTATLRTNRSLHIESKKKLIEFLTTIKKLPEFVKTFETAKLRKIMDAGLLESDIATWDENKTIAIKLAEVEQ